MQGCREKTDTFNPNPKDWSAFRSRDYGYTRMQVVNATHLYLEQVSDDQVQRGACKHTYSKGECIDLMVAEYNWSDNNDCFFSVFQYGKVIDNIWVVKEKHGFSAWFWRLPKKPLSPQEIHFAPSMHFLLHPNDWLFLLNQAFKK